MKNWKKGVELLYQILLMVAVIICILKANSIIAVLLGLGVVSVSCALGQIVDALENLTKKDKETTAKK